MGVVKLIYHFIINAFFSFVSIIGIILHSNRSYHKKILFLKGIKTVNKIRILGNGESLRDKLNSFNDSYDYFVVNRHVLSSSYTVIKPRYYVIADPLFFENKDEFHIIELIKELTTWNMYLFIPNTKNNKHLKNYFAGTNITLILYNGHPFKGYECLEHKFYDWDLSMPRVQNVIVAATFISLKMGYKEIELHGVEHSWTKYLTVNENNEVCLYNPHFFDKQSVRVKTFREIHHATDGWRMHEVLRAYAQMFESYWTIENYSNTIDAKIVNKTKDSFIDAFTKQID